MAGKLVTLLLLATALVQISVGEVCTKEGKVCSSDCKQVIFCLSVGSDSVLVETCSEEIPATQFCSEGECNAETCAGDPSLMPYICTGFGTFPDTQNCTKYYQCSAGGVQPQFECACTKEEYYNTSTSSCQSSSSTGCKSHIVDCSEVGKCGDIPPWFDDNKPTEFGYICSQLTENGAIYPLVFPCQGTVNNETCACTSTETNGMLSSMNTKDISVQASGTCVGYHPPNPNATIVN